MISSNPEKRTSSLPSGGSRIHLPAAQPLIIRSSIGKFDIQQGECAIDRLRLTGSIQTKARLPAGLRGVFLRGPMRPAESPTVTGVNVNRLLPFPRQRRATCRTKSTRRISLRQSKSTENPNGLRDAGSPLPRGLPVEAALRRHVKSLQGKHPFTRLPVHFKFFPHSKEIPARSS